MIVTSRRLKRLIFAIVTLGLAAVLCYLYLAKRLPPVPKQPLRIGFEPNPPFQIRTSSGVGGFAVEVVNEAAKRSGIHLTWVETGTSSDEAFQKGLVDLWPLMADVPDRRKRLYLSRPWSVNAQILVSRAGTPVPDQGFTGAIGVFKMPLEVRLAREKFRNAQVQEFPIPREVLKAVCKGVTTAGMLDQRVARDALLEQPPVCGSTSLRMYQLPDLTLKNCVASTFAASWAAARLRKEIGKMYRDGSLAAMSAKYSFYGLDDNWANFELMEATDRAQWIAWGTAAFSVALFLAAWQTFSLRQRKRSERKLRESEERFRAIFLQAGVGVAQVSLKGRLEMANDRYYEVFGRRREDLLRRGTLEITHAEDVKEQLAMMPRLLSGEIQSFSIAKRYIREDGSFVWAEVCKSLVRDVDGKPKCLIAVVQDISERKQAEAALKESEERFRNMADSAPVMIWVSGPDKLCTFFNKGWLEFTGRTFEQELGNGWAEGVHPEDLERCIGSYASAFDKRADFQMEYRLRRGDGEYRWVLDRGVARFSTDGAFAGYIGSALDITDLKRNYEQHLATQKLESVGVLAAGVAHDFNNLLGAIIARAESTLTEHGAGSGIAGDVEQIRLTALRAAEIVSQLMTFAGQENAPSTAIDLSSLVTEILDLLKVSIAKTAVLTKELSPHLPLVYANPTEIRQVVMNLVINASEALEGKPGRITVTTAPAILGADSAVRLEIRDTGSGMTEDVKARIFDPFFTTRFMGRGLGLSAVQGVVRRHGGSIEVDSAPGQGSRFAILLPASGVQAESVAPAVERDSPFVQTQGAVLFVEDEEVLRSVVAKILRRRNFEVIEAADGRSAIEKLESDPDRVQVILLDVTLPGISGAELFDELRRVRPGIKVILSTAYAQETVMRGFEGRDVWGFIRKPYRTDELVKLLQRASRESNAIAHS